MARAESEGLPGHFRDHAKPVGYDDSLSARTSFSIGTSRIRGPEVRPVEFGSGTLPITGSAGREPMRKEGIFLEAASVSRCEELQIREARLPRVVENIALSIPTSHVRSRVPSGGIAWLLRYFGTEAVIARVALRSLPLHARRSRRRIARFPRPRHRTDHAAGKGSRGPACRISQLHLPERRTQLDARDADPEARLARPDA